MNSQPVFGLVIVGDEILSGKRTDLHLPFVIDLLNQYGQELSWVSMVGDQYETLRDCFRASMAKQDIVFSFGGIGATPDDITRQCAADAAGSELQRHPEAAALISDRFGHDITDRRLQMADFPSGATLIPNPVNQVAGFSLGTHHFVPGFPQMAHPMLQWLMQEKYSDLKRTPDLEKICVVKNTPESELIPTMKRIIAEFPDIRLSSLPSISKGGIIELGIKGRKTNVKVAYQKLTKELSAGNHDWQHKLIDGAIKTSNSTDSIF